MYLPLFRVLGYSDVEAAAYLFRVDGGGADGVNNHHVGPSVGVRQVTAEPLPQRVHHARLV